MNNTSCSDELLENEGISILKSNVDMVEADVIISLLRSYDIPVMRKSKGSSQMMEIMFGNSFYGTDLYVPTSALEQAQEIIAKNNATLLVNNKELKDKTNMEGESSYMKAKVDRDACISCGLCASVCPEVFKLDEESISTVIADPIPEEFESSAKEAAEQCPTNAISVE